MYSVKYSCAVCDRACAKDTMECSACKDRIHISCLNVDSAKLEFRSSRQISFRCRKCTFNGNKYDAAAALER